jgi:hypothetical protein
MTLIAIAVALTVAAAPPPAKTKPASNDTMKGLLKDAVVTTPAANPDGGTEAAARPGPDVDKMPFTPLSIQNVVAFYAPQIQGCYEETLAAKDKAVEGKLMTSFIIMPDGMVKKPQVLKKGTTLKDPRLHDCVLAVLGTMAFPKPTDNKDHPIEYPFNLKAIQ